MATWQVAVSEDDCERIPTPNYWSTTYNFAAGWTDATYVDYGGAARFLNVTIPSNATIISAYLELVAYYTRTATVVNTRLRAELNVAPATFSTAANFDARTWTTAYVNWDAIPAWTADEEYTSPDIKTCIQEVANLDAITHLVVLWDDFERRSTQGPVNQTWRSAYSYDISTTLAPYLIVTYTVNYPITTSLNMGYATTVSRATASSRTSSLALGLASTVGRTIDVSRSSALNTGFAVTVDRAWGRTRNSAVDFGMATTVTRATAMNRSSAVVMGLLPTVSRLIGYSRAASHSLGLEVTTTRVINVSRTTSSVLGMAVSVVRQIAINKTASLVMGQAVTVSRAAAIARTVSNSIGYAVTATRNIAVARAASVSLGLAVTVSRLVDWGKSVSLTFGHAVSSVIRQRLLRHRAQTGTNRDLSEIGTNRDVAQTGTNRDIEPW